MAEKNTEARWYVAHTYSGYENKVKMDLEKTIDNRGLQDVILEVSGYVLVNMVMNDETWYVVRNTRGVTGFVGPGSKPVPLSEEEILTLGYRKSEVLVDFAEGDTVSVVSGAWKDTIGVITEINDQKKTVTINVEMFGRDTPVELSYGEVQKLR